jgi:hypothetical protein
VVLVGDLADAAAAAVGDQRAQDEELRRRELMLRQKREEALLQEVDDLKRQIPEGVDVLSKLVQNRLRGVRSRRSSSFTKV